MNPRTQCSLPNLKNKGSTNTEFRITFIHIAMFIIATFVQISNLCQLLSPTQFHFEAGGESRKQSHLLRAAQQRTK